MKYDTTRDIILVSSIFLIYIYLDKFENTYVYQKKVLVFLSVIALIKVIPGVFLSSKIPGSKAAVFLNPINGNAIEKRMELEYHSQRYESALMAFKKLVFIRYRPSSKRDYRTSIVERYYEFRKKGKLPQDLLVFLFESLEYSTAEVKFLLKRFNTKTISYNDASFFTKAFLKFRNSIETTTAIRNFFESKDIVLLGYHPFRVLWTILHGTDRDSVKIDFITVKTDFKLRICAWGTPYDGVYPVFEMFLNGKKEYRTSVRIYKYWYEVEIKNLSIGKHTLLLKYVNNKEGINSKTNRWEDRNLVFEKVVVNYEKSQSIM